jgi:hypothetical protein
VCIARSSLLPTQELERVEGMMRGEAEDEDEEDDGDGDNGDGDEDGEGMVDAEGQAGFDFGTRVVFYSFLCEKRATLCFFDIRDVVHVSFLTANVILADFVSLSTSSGAYSGHSLIDDDAAAYESAALAQYYHSEGGALEGDISNNSLNPRDFTAYAGMHPSCRL